MSSEITSKMHDWVVKINEKVSDMKISIPATEVKSVYLGERFYKLDKTTREKFSESDYKPRIVSFGPCYYGHPSSVSTQRRKEDVLVYFLKKSNKKLDDYVEVLKQNISIKSTYEELDPTWQQDDDAFVQLMILDGCFCLEAAREACLSLEADRSNRDYISNNPVWGIDGLSIVELREHYVHDMLLLENQIPMAVFYDLCQIEFNDSYEGAMARAINTICKLPSPLPMARIQPYFAVHGIVALYQDNLLGFTDFSGWNRLKLVIAMSCFPSIYFKTSTTELQFNIPSAVELEKVGIRFTTTETMTASEVSFSGRTLCLPQISVDGATKSIFVNIIALEILYAYRNKVITSYVYLMSRLLRSEDDVKLLESLGIVHSALSCNEIIKVFDNMTTKDIMHNPDIFLISSYKQMGGNLRTRYNKMSKGWQRDLWQNYLRSPFGIVSIIVAFFLFALTIIQTVYTVLGYYNPK